MTCETVRRQLLTLPLSDFSSLRPHLEGCSECAAIAAEINAGHAWLDADLEDFSMALPFREALASAKQAEEQPAPTTVRKRWQMMNNGLHIGATLAAAAAALVSAGLYSMRTTNAGDDQISESSLVAVGAEVPESCEPMQELAEKAMLGALETKSVTCLEARVKAGGEDQFDAVTLLAVNAYSAGDMEAWLGYAEQSIELFPDNVDLNYKLALHHMRGGVDSAKPTLHYADLALQNNITWTGEVFKKRVFNLHKISANASNQLFRADPGDAEARAHATKYTLEWLRYAEASNQKTEVAYELCLSLTSEEACNGD